jgi:hypothetical protein
MSELINGGASVRPSVSFRPPILLRKQIHAAAVGLTDWTTHLEQGASLGSVVQEFMNSAEYQKSHAGMTNAQLIDSLYVNALGRHAEPSALQDWVNALAHGTSQTTVAAGIVESPEAQQHHLSQIEKGWVHT